MLPAEQAILAGCWRPGGPLYRAERDSALAEGRNRPLAQVIAARLALDPPHRACPVR